MLKFEVTIARVGGEIDINATLAAARTTLEGIETSERVNNDLIAEKVAEVWGDYPAMSSFQLGVLAAYTMQKLSVPATEFEAMQERVKEYVRNATDLFHIAKGKGGGVQNLSRLDVKGLEKVAEQRAKAEAAETAAAAKLAAAV